MTTVIELKNVSKKYILKFQKRALVKDLIPGILTPKITKDFWALQDINIEIKQGEVVGIIGDNGAGKTTLLSIIAKIVFPTEGKVSTKGRIYPLLTLGAGFHRELSGEDNIYLNGLLLGLSMEEIKARINRIIEFSELGSFIKLPIYTYSSGMLLRLGFAIAVEVDFDILLLDEILSVGDFSFQKKCINKIKQFISSGKTLVISSQSLDLIEELCTRVILLERGKIKADGLPSEVISYYRQLKERKGDFLIQGLDRQLQLIRNVPEDIERIKGSWGKKFGNGKAEILKVEFQDLKGNSKRIFETGEPLQIYVEAEVKDKIVNPHLGIAIFRNDYNYCHGPNTKFDQIMIPEIKPQRFNFALRYKNLILADGRYKISVAIWDEEEKDPYIYHCAYYDLRVENKIPIRGLLDLEHNWYHLSEGKKRLEKQLDYEFDKFLQSMQNFYVQDEEMKFGRLSLCDKKMRIKEIFFTNEYLGLLIKIITPTRQQELSLMTALFKLDGLLIHQTGTVISAWEEGEVLLEYPKFPILMGEYVLICFLSDKNLLKIYDYSMKRFTVLSKMRDHGVVFMEHDWDICYKR